MIKPLELTIEEIYAICPDDEGWRLPNCNYLQIGDGVSLGYGVSLV